MHRFGLFLVLLVYLTSCVTYCYSSDVNEEGPLNGHITELGSSASANIIVASFNIQVFGTAKMSKADVVNKLVLILSRYDIVAIQEIRDSTDTAFRELMARLVQDSGRAYSSIVSERLGRTTAKEQYAFIYDTAKVKMISSFQLPDPKDIFERAPFAAQFEANGHRVVFLDVHVKPLDAVQEVDSLTDAYDKVVSHFGGDDNVLILGDMNAGCDYLPNYAWEDIRLFTEPRFKWLIDNKIDTTVSREGCAYDRFIVTGSWLPGAILPGTVSVFNFKEEYSLTLNKAKTISDHFPIQLSMSFAPKALVADSAHSSDAAAGVPDSGLPPAAIVGLSAAAAVVAGGAMVVAVVCVIRRRKPSPAPTAQPYALLV